MGNLGLKSTLCDFRIHAPTTVDAAAPSLLKLNKEKILKSLVVKIASVEAFKSAFYISAVKTKPFLMLKL